MTSNSLTVTDTTTGLTVTIPIGANNTIPATSFTQFKIAQTCPAPDAAPVSTTAQEGGCPVAVAASGNDNKVPIRLYDPGFKNTAVCKTTISSVDGENGKLFYRGYDVEELVEKSDFLEVAYLLIYGDLPSSQKVFEEWVGNVMHHTYLHVELERQMRMFRFDAHPMGMVVSTIASLSTFHPEANPALKGEGLYMNPKIAAGQQPTDSDVAKIEGAKAARSRAIYRILGKIPTIAANAYRHRLGRPYNRPMFNGIDYCENLLYMMDHLNEPDYRPDPRLVKILNKAFILLAENGSNCSTIMVRHLSSSGVDPFTNLAGAAGALFGERKSAAVIEMLQKIGSVDNIDKYLELVKLPGTSSGATDSIRSSSNMRKTRVRLMGFGHRIYKTHDPRVRICKGLVLELFELMGKNSVGELAIALEAKALADPYFTDRKLYPNIDYWMGVLFHTLQFPSDMFPVWMFIPRVAGMLAHLIENIDDPEYKIYRPRQIYIGQGRRQYEGLGRKRAMSLSSDMAPPKLDIHYGLSDPQAARRRGATAEADALEELNHIQKALADVSSLIDGFVPNKEASTNESETLEKLRKEVARLNKAQEHLAADILSNRKSTADAGSGASVSTSNPRGHQSEGTNLKTTDIQSARLAVGKTPDLLAGSRSPRVIARQKNA
ncbi:hypothetical protein BASA50_009503 [Batrachochytrium salamandrivorans]|uniref:Citrate synthase n=1 Tax=Batrachochytrium salamandrivorans TaxID=1357716 RepID=A0ABQ8F282_9FUNG|nr:hypothetical protein BASA62_009843 [Batrachochytrium salamandrivorans]KAH6565150.1 hypothetical protein BASA60_010026 [Batrachochytrium salamandrivorans]KAH6585772.1 hypothetical protein BASA61_006756 [Batrachochytrium salamandrivorans]KAH6590242.1 hypothetical protein BASA50_009503 [Batrachochytrium salamandrivorans]KAH9251310.1 hypothetical protein BASA81_010868 [Batrachochytrium salamandrivorans]